jgi:hypothetical protein
MDIRIPDQNTRLRQGAHRRVAAPDQAVAASETMPTSTLRPATVTSDVARPW